MIIKKNSCDSALSETIHDFCIFIYSQLIVKDLFLSNTYVQVYHDVSKTKQYMRDCTCVVTSEGLLPRLIPNLYLLSFVVGNTYSITDKH